MISYKTENLKDILDMQKNIRDMQLLDSLRYKLQKNKIELEDLLNIEDIVIDGETISGMKNDIDLKDIECFPNLKSIEIKNISISKTDMKYLENIPNIKFLNCKIEGLEKINNCQSLSFVNCSISNMDELYSFNNLREYAIIKTKSNNFDYLKNKDITKLVIKNVEEFNIDKINFKLPIKYLSLEGIDSIDYDVLGNFENLETISIDYLRENKLEKDIPKLIEKGYKVKYNDMY